jgi:hypothetical protein
MARTCLISCGTFLLVATLVGAADDGPAPKGGPKIPVELLEKRVEAARKVYEQNRTRLQNAQGLPAELFGWSERLLEAELALSDKEGVRAKAFRDHFDRTREVERLAAGFARAGQGRQADADAATYFRLEAEIRLHKEGIEPHPAKGQN